MTDENTVDCLHTASLILPALHLEIYADPALSRQHPDWPKREKHLEALMQAVWPHFLEVAAREGVFDTLGLAPTLAAGTTPGKHTLEIELSWTGNDFMHRLNRDYRDKDAATDVLTFTLLADAPDPAPWLALPVLQLGGIFISIDWADDAIRENPALNADAYLMERFIHGLLHLHGQHHDTMPEYERVVRIQKSILAAAGIL
jgi:probable rRNA maturation factor